MIRHLSSETAKHLPAYRKTLFHLSDDEKIDKVSWICVYVIYMDIHIPCVEDGPISHLN